MSVAQDAQWNGHRKIADYSGSAGAASAAAVSSAPFSVALVKVHNTHATQTLYVNFVGGNAATDDADRCSVAPATQVDFPVHLVKTASITVAASGASTTFTMQLLGGI